LRVVFAGTPAFATPALEALARTHSVALVLTQPDRPAGRGMKLAPSPVAATASRLGLPVAKPGSLRSDAALAQLRAAAPDMMVVAAYGLILPQEALDIPALGSLNIHASLLPRWRGAAPIQRAILAGDTTTGISIMRMEAGLDTGPVLLERAVSIDAGDTTGSLTEKLAQMGAEALVEALARIDSLTPVAQDPARVTYASKVSKAEARIDWSLPAEEIARRVRAFNPAPGAEGQVGGILLKVWEAEALDTASMAPGVVSEASGQLVVGCGRGALRLLVVQRPGGRRMPAREFLQGKPWAHLPGDHATH
jgi:methionyl-tRNA formyltransferase